MPIRYGWLTLNSKGTKVFSLAGNINNTGLVEVPLGITLKEIIYDIGVGIPGVENSRRCRRWSLRWLHAGEFA